MFRPKFLSIEQILQLQNLSIQEFGGTHGVRDLTLLQSAKSQRESIFGDDYFHRNVYEMAAAYLFHIVQNHPFVDGNKRAGALVSAVFLEINRLELCTTEEEFEAIVMDTASGSTTKQHVATFFTGRSRKLI